MKRDDSLSFFTFLFSCLFLLTVSFVVSKWNDWESQKLITWDSSGYYMYLPGFFYDDLGELHNHQYIIDTYKPCGNFLNEHRSPIGKYVIKYSCGMAILYLPGFTAGHIYAKLGNYPVDGFSFPYQFCMAMYSVLVSMIGLWLCRKLLLKYFSDGVVAFVLITLTLATNYLNYAAVSNMFSHSYLFSIYCALILLSLQWHKKFEYKCSIAIGLLCGLAALCRPTEVISVLVPFIWGIGSIGSIKERIQTLIAHKKQVLVLFLIAIAVGSIQLIYWKVYSGKFLYWSYADSDDKLNFLRVHFAQAMFSYQKGWLVYTPFMFLSMVGFLSLLKKDRKLFFPAFSFVAIAFYIAFSWKNWAYGGSFSMRAVIQYYAFLVFPIAALFEYALNKKIWLLLVIPFTIFCIWLNLIMHYQANFGGMESDNMNKAYFWKIFGRTNIDQHERKLTETGEEIPLELIPNLKLMGQISFCSDSTNWTEHCTDFDSGKAFLLTKESEFIPETRVNVSDKKGKWAHTTCEVFVKKGEDNPSSQPLFYNWLIDSNQQEVKKVEYHFLRYMPYEKWDTITIDIFIPKDSKGEILKCGIYNPKGDVQIYMRKLKVEYAD